MRCCLRHTLEQTLGALLYGGVKVKAGRLRKAFLRGKVKYFGEGKVSGSSIGCWRCVFCALSAVSAVR